ncbi:hypothetical protein Tco_1141766 [Tanacetum coccineum]
MAGPNWQPKESDTVAEHVESNKPLSEIQTSAEDLLRECVLSHIQGKKVDDIIQPYSDDIISASACSERTL